MNKIKGYQYTQWLSLILALNKDVVIKKKRMELEITQKYQEKKEAVERKYKEDLGYANACQQEISEMMGLVNNHLITHGKQINSCHDTINDQLTSVQIDLRTALGNIMTIIRNTGRSILMIQPGWFTKEQPLYAELYRSTVQAYSLISAFKNDIEENTKSQYKYLFMEMSRLKNCAEEELRKQGGETINELNSLLSKSDYAGLEWRDEHWCDWEPSNNAIPQLVKLGQFCTNEFETQFSVPAYVSFQNGSGIFFKTTPDHYQDAIRASTSLMLRLLYTTQPGKIEFTLIDPVQLGGSVSELLTLGDIDPDLINKQVCSSTDQIAKKLSIISEQIKTIQQVYLKTDFDSIEAYNESVKTMAEPYRIVFINDFPVNFTNDAIRYLIAIAKNGPKCGIYPIIIAPSPYQHYDAQLFSDIENSSILINAITSKIFIDDPRFDLYSLILDEAPNFSVEPHFKTMSLKVADKSLDNKKIEYSYSDMLKRVSLERDMWWSSSTGEYLDVPLGPSGAKRIQSLKLGVEMAHSVLCVGRPGSGKSNLMSVIITTLALKYSPAELQLYLIDLKNGITFKQYAKHRLPHAKTIAIDSDREFSLAVLRGIETEMLFRSAAFRNSGTDSLAIYRQKTGKVMPRVLVIIDEFQDLFSDIDLVNKEATRILEQIIREGRQVGIHVFLGTQSLSGVSVSKAILDLVAVRIALQCSEAESRVVLSEDNPAAKLLNKPGEAIYNCSGGLPDSNVRFQVAYYRNEDNKYLPEIESKSKEGSNIYEPIVFDGSDPVKISNLSIMKNYIHGKVLAKVYPCAWLGKPISMEETLFIEFKKGPGNHLCIVDANRETSVGVLISILLSLCVCSSQPPTIYFMSYDDDDSEQRQFTPIFSEMTQGGFKVITRRGLTTVLENLKTETNNDEDYLQPPRFLVLDGIHKSHDFETDDYSETDEKKRKDALRQIVKYGADKGIHVILRSESFERMSEILDRTINEIKYRIAGSLEYNYSLQYVSDQSAARIEKSNRLLLYKADAGKQQEKYIQFIPYEIPDIQFVVDVAAAKHRQEVSTDVQ